MIDRQKFFAGIRSGFGSLSQDQVTALNALLDAIEADAEMTDLRWVAYALATVRHETANTYRPIAEYGHGHGRPYGHKDAETGRVYYGRGFIQLTHRENYKKLGDLLGVDLLHDPELALEINTAYQILSLGMRNGLFAKGQTLGRYIHDDVCDYLHARKIINAMDKAELIAGYATTFEGILNDSQQEAPAIPDTVATNKTTIIEKTTNVVSGLAGNEQLKQVASEGVTKLAVKGATWMGTASTVSGTSGAATHNNWLLILSIIFGIIAGTIIICAVLHKSRKEARLVEIAADRTKNDVEVIKK